MKKQTNLIYCHYGCYGTFFEWCYFYFNNEISYYPFTDTGSSHNYYGNMFTPKKLWDYINSDSEVKVGRCHIGIFDERTNNNFYELIKEDLNHLILYFNKIVIIYPDITNTLWVENNVYEKINSFKSMTRIFRDIIKKDLPYENYNKWKKETLDEFEAWELRELAALYWTNRQNNEFTCWTNIVKEFSTIENIKFISMNDLKTNTFLTLQNYLEFFEVELHDDKKLEDIISVWKPKQIHCNKDELINLIVKSLLTDANFDWSDEKITFCDEVHIQKLLLNHGYEIKCYNLNVLPTNTEEFSKLLLKV